MKSVFVSEDEQVDLPGWVIDFESFRRWMHTDSFPDDGRICFIHGAVWVEDNGFLRPIKIRLGLTDGNMTEVADGKLQEGTPVVVGEGRAAAAGGDDGANPFAPKMFGGKKKMQ